MSRGWAEGYSASGRSTSGTQRYTGFRAAPVSPNRRRGVIRDGREGAEVEARYYA